jgi:toxin ParE1/3/4
MQILWLDRAEADLDELFDYLLARDPGAARRVYGAIRERVELLAEQPHLGRPGRVADTRELVISGTSHIVAYTIDRHIDAVVILRVLHGARRWPDAF